MSVATIGGCLAWALALFFAVGGAVNWIAPRSIRGDYMRWGYPGWFHYVTALLEFLVAALLLAVATRAIGIVLGSAVMAIATATLLLHREYAHAVAPTIVLFLTVVSGWLLIASH